MNARQRRKRRRSLKKSHLALGIEEVKKYQAYIVDKLRQTIGFKS